jgi:hypothetical protein
VPPLSLRLPPARHILKLQSTFLISRGLLLPQRNAAAVLDRVALRQASSRPRWQRRPVGSGNVSKAPSSHWLPVVRAACDLFDPAPNQAGFASQRSPQTSRPQVIIPRNNVKATAFFVLACSRRAASLSRCTVNVKRLFWQGVLQPLHDPITEFLRISTLCPLGGSSKRCYHTPHAVARSREGGRGYHVNFNKLAGSTKYHSIIHSVGRT